MAKKSRAQRRKEATKSPNVEVKETREEVESKKVSKVVEKHESSSTSTSTSTGFFDNPIVLLMLAIIGASVISYGIIMCLNHFSLLDKTLPTEEATSETAISEDDLKSLLGLSDDTDINYGESETVSDEFTVTGELSSDESVEDSDVDAVEGESEVTESSDSVESDESVESIETDESEVAETESAEGSGGDAVEVGSAESVAE